MPPPVRESYNAKARQSTAGSRKKGKPKNRNKTNHDGLQEDPNASIISPESKEDKEKAKKERLLADLAAQTDGKWTSKKKKRLEKYIDKKLKKEERVLIFEKLIQTQASLPSSLLQSSATLGTGKLSTHQELQEKAEDRDVRKAFAGQAGKRKRHQDAFPIHHAEEELDSEDGNLLGGSSRNTPTRIAQDSLERSITVVDSSTQHSSMPPNSSQNASTVGGALHRNPDGSVAAPKVRVRSKGKQVIQRGWGRRPDTVVQDESDTSFDSSDSEYDSSNDMSDSEEGADLSESEEKEEEFEPSQDMSTSKPKTLGFKEWAMKQLSTAKGFELLQSPEPAPTGHDEQPPPPKKKRKLGNASSTQEMRGPLGEDLKLPTTTLAKHLLNAGNKDTTKSYVKAVSVKRPPEVEESRILLPIVTEEQPIMEAILLNPVVIICGETGSGKTTQVPQFLYEAGFGTPGSENPGMIGITQPRRVAAMSMATRVAHELSLTSSRVSYQIRYDATVSSATSIKFMTDGVLLRELATDFLLTKYSVIIIDEAHERSMNTDILIGVLSRVIKLREDMWKEGKENIRPLRLIVMSATLRVNDFVENKTLFASPPPVITVAARQHPVTIHFSRRTYPDYVKEAIKKTTKIHNRLPPGGILIFLTGQNEITGVCRKLEARFGKKAIDEKKRKRSEPQNHKQDVRDEDEPSVTATPAQVDIEAEDLDLGNAVPDDIAFDVDGNIDEDPDPEALDTDDEETLDEELGLQDDSGTPMHIVPLYALLPSDKQMRVFQTPPPGSRLVVVSTNIAETSLTIPGIRYVIDCGRAKERRYDVANGIQAFQVSWIAKASAAQRAGRAGRTGPGHCYRLYSSALFEHHLENFAIPEIQRMPIEGVVLQMKSMHIDAIVNFPFPTPPDRLALQKAEKTLGYLGALSAPSSVSRASGAIEYQITDLGRTMALFPLSPRFSRMLVSGQQHGCLPYVICIVSAMSVGDPFIYEDALEKDEELEQSDKQVGLVGLKSEAIRDKEERRLVRKAFFQSQHMHASLGGHTSDLFKTLSVVGAYEPKAMEEIHKLRAQISNIVHHNFRGIDAGFIPLLPPPNDRQLKVLRQLLTAGFIDQVAVRKDVVEKNQSTGTQFATSRGVAYRALGIPDDVYIHPSSLLASTPPPDYVAYQEVVRTSRIYLKGLTVVNAPWLSALGKDTLCVFSKPVKNNVGNLMVIPRFGPDGWELPPVKANSSHGVQII
ncbi:P-loop containing nucleoside triphosphate hydrolase protein [Crassisporium funariophilum]|nr:P-loop containing nucleoside triphosphate hydrolase protein [Crassisporium funariophilum]